MLGLHNSVEGAECKEWRGGELYRVESVGIEHEEISAPSGRRY
jgi:hypothetical protein